MLVHQPEAPATQSLRQVSALWATFFISDVVASGVFLASGADLVIAHMLGFTCATALALLMAAPLPHTTSAGWIVRLSVVSLLVLVLRSILVFGLVDKAEWPAALALLPGIALSGLASCIATPFIRIGSSSAEMARGVLVLIFIYGLLLRLIVAGSVDLIPEESYYWAYAQQLDIGYLDHPPMVAWLIWLGVELIGSSELAVRLPALVCWAIVATFSFLLTRNLFDEPTAVRGVVLLSVLPVFFAFGLLMTPDAPLCAAWAGALYYLERALVANRGWAWLGVGFFIGLGMLSKYTIALLGVTTVMFLVIDRNARRWLSRPQPYVAFVIVVVLFSPVIAWNAANEWGSFIFQGPGRWSGQPEFTLHVLLTYALLLITPAGLVGIAVAFTSKDIWRRFPESSELLLSRRRFVLLFTLVPLCVFAVHALQGETKLNWTGPVWLASLPLLARYLADHRMSRWWQPASVVLLLLYGVGFHYLQLGLPGYQLPGSMNVPVAWEQMARQIEVIEDSLQDTTGKKPIVAGVDKYYISSQHAFYDPDDDGFAETSGRHLFGGNSLMWEEWQPAGLAAGKDIILVGFHAARLASSRFDCFFARMGETEKLPVLKRDKVVAYFYVRIGYNYDPAALGCV